MNDEAKIEHLIGQTVVEVRGAKGSDVLEFVLSDGRTFVMYHQQDCCESVSVEDICGDLNDLVGYPLLQAEEVSSEGTPGPENADSFTWTFYRLATVNGAVTIRWLGESNGYYSESVDCTWR